MAGTQESPRVISPEAADLLERIREHYRAQNKASAASNYVRHLRAFFHWAEGSGYTLHTLPADAVEAFLRSTGQKETTTYVMRTQIKSALRAAHNDLGVDFAHLQYESGKPKAVHRAQKEREKEKRADQRLARAAATLNLPFIPAPAIANRPPPTPYVEATPEEIDMPAEVYPAEAPASVPASPTGPVSSPVGASQPQIVVVPMQTQQPQRPQQNQQNQQRPMGTIGGGVPQRGIQINNHSFSGSHIRVSRVADGSDPFVPMGTETYVTTLMASQLAPHGDVAAYMQQFIIPKLRLSPNTSQVPFVFHELNDRKQPTGRRDELVVSVPLSMVADGATPPPAAFHGLPVPATPPVAFDLPTQMMLKKLESDSEASQRREEKLAEELKQAKDSQMQFFLMQQMQREQELKRELEERKMFELARAQQAAATPPPMPVMMPPEPPRPDPAIELTRIREEANARLLEAVLVKAMTPPPPPPPPPPQKDVTEWLIPLMSQMNQQMVQQQQANQQMMIQMMQSNQQFVQATMMAQLQKAEAQANAPKEDDLEAFADRFQKFKMLTEMMPGGGGGDKGGGLIEALVSNFDTIGAGIAKVMSSRGAPTLSAAPEQQSSPPMQLPAPEQAQAQAQAPLNLSPTMALLEEAAKLAEDETRSREVIEKVIQMINTYATMPEPAADMGRRMVRAIGQVEDADDVLNLAKHFWIALSQKPDKPAAKAIAKALIAWFPVLHKNIFGEVRFLEGQNPATYAPPAGQPPQGEVQVAEETEEESDSEEEESEEESEDESEDGVVSGTDDAVMATVGA